VSQAIISPMDSCGLRARCMCRDGYRHRRGPTPPTRNFLLAESELVGNPQECVGVVVKPNDPFSIWGTDETHDDFGEVRLLPRSAAPCEISATQA
jgi:hypothetical protein